MQSAYVRDWRGVIEREEAQIGVLISMEAPTKRMLKEAAEAGFYKPPGLEDRYPRLQTFKKAPKATPAAEKKTQLPFDSIEDYEGPF